MRPPFFVKCLWVLLVACLVAGPAYGKGRNCTAEERAAADKQLRLSKRDAAAAIERHLPWGVPEAAGPVANLLVLAQRDYAIGYDRALRVPLWTAHRLQARGLGKEDRVNCFRRDPRIGAPAASLPTDYREPVFDQGHLAPNGDMSFRLIPVLNSFVLSNMTPQFCQFNRGVWQILESLVRLWVKERNPLYVVTGSVFDHDGNGRRDADEAAPRMKSTNGKARVAVPSAFYKILIRQNDDGTVESLAFLVPHDQTDVDGEEALSYLGRHLVSIEEIEAVAGLRLFPAMSRPLPGRADRLWPFEGRIPRSLVDDRCRETANLDW